MKNRALYAGTTARVHAAAFDRRARQWSVRRGSLVDQRRVLQQRGLAERIEHLGRQADERCTLPRDLEVEHRGAERTP